MPSAIGVISCGLRTAGEFHKRLNRPQNSRLIHTKSPIYPHMFFPILAITIAGSMPGSELAGQLLLHYDERRPKGEITKRRPTGMSSQRTDCLGQEFEVARDSVASNTPAIGGDFAPATQGRQRIF